MDKKDTYKFQLKQGRRVICRGITIYLFQSEAELQIGYPNSKVHKVGRRTTHNAAHQWEIEGGKRPYKKCTHDYKYAKLENGTTDIMHCVCTKCGKKISRPFTIKL